ncbi:hypothetical protein ACIQAC_18500 [Streptomyces sp. NPDC088387]|uniref:hypothetical protein n=1 Tax=Streptomyces sp. NPDC088387 TaxID=3365859 RepID=UPI00380CAC0E
MSREKTHHPTESGLTTEDLAAATDKDAKGTDARSTDARSTDPRSESAQRRESPEFPGEAAVPAAPGFGPEGAAPVTPGTTPSTAPGSTPSSTSGTAPGATPGSTRGATPGTPPGAAPNRAPQAAPDMAPGKDSAAIPRPGHDGPDRDRDLPGHHKETGREKTADDEATQLLTHDEEEPFRLRWEKLQTRFVDDPREAVDGADALIADVMQSLAATFAEHKRELEGQWKSGGEADTEELRLVLRKYRSFFNRLLST